MIFISVIFPMILVIAWIWILSFGNYLFIYFGGIFHLHDD